MDSTAALVLVLGTGCASVRPQLVAQNPPTPAIAQAVEAFYGATTVAQLESAVAAASAADPSSFLAHELAARLAQLRGDEGGFVTHLLAALRDRANDASALHLHLLLSVELTFEQRRAVRPHLQVIAEQHPDPETRAVAAHHLASLLNQEGRLAERAAVLANIPGVVDLAVVGTWDNDQGKGYDMELEPERRPDLGQTYEGRSGPLHWRPHAPLDPRGRLDLSAQMSPTRWAVAYAQGELAASEDGPHELRLMSSDPLKVWVNGKLVFAAPQLARSVYDHLVVPLTLTRGRHRLLIKSAHRDGNWYLAARLTHGGPAPATGQSVDQVLAWRGSRLSDLMPLRRRALQVAWSHQGAGGVFTVRLADQYLSASPSILARLSLADALWYNQERGRTADVLQALDLEFGATLPFVRLRQTRFHLQQGLRQKARERLLELVRANPEVREAYEQLAELYRAEAWNEDELRTMRELAARFGSGPDSLGELAQAQLRSGRRSEALESYRTVLAQLPAYGDVLRRMADLELEAGRLPEAERYLERRLESWPTDLSGLLELAEVRRRARSAKAVDALEAAQRLAPESPVPSQRLGDLAYEAGDVARALTHWRRALELHPENESLANRVDFLAPEARGPWMSDIPDEATLEAAVKRRQGLNQAPGADVAWLLDHEVTLLNSDGSTSNVVTHVIHAFNAQGRDRIVRQAVQPGRLRVLHAYSVDEKGLRSEASSERARQIFFRAMQPGSTLVLQYRIDQAPRGYLARFYTEQWSFQGPAEQRVESTFVLWSPIGTTLNEHRVGDVQRSETRVGDQLRVVWAARDVLPLISEPSMPTGNELAANIRISTVPDWKTWLSWEQALLEGVFRSSPELDSLAATLGEGNPGPEEKVRRVHQFVMEEIRYQQDYETFIAGVKPHPAPVVLERKYGDCKDKAVLFIELAKKLGVTAHFALVRTRDAGPVDADVPMQQFNHAIVYVPEQPGVSAGRFFDPTAELLDLDSVRADDVGTRSLVYDPSSASHEWREIPYQRPEANRERHTLSLELRADGHANGTLTLDAVGKSGSALRRMSRNSEVFAQVGQRAASMLVPNATASNPTVLENKSLRDPAVVRLDLEARAFARQEGDTWRVRLPTDFSPRSYFTLANRRHPLVLGAPTLSQVDLELKLPEGAKVRRLPSSGKVELPCLSLERKVTTAGRVVRSQQSFRITCERVSAAEYQTYRARAEEMTRLLDDELVIGRSASRADPAGRR